MIGAFPHHVYVSDSRNLFKHIHASSIANMYHASCGPGFTNVPQKPSKVAVVRIEEVDFFSDKQVQILQRVWMMTVNAILEETTYTEIT